MVPKGEKKAIVEYWVLLSWLKSCSLSEITEFECLNGGHLVSLTYAKLTCNGWHLNLKFYEQTLRIQTSFFPSQLKKKYFRNTRTYEILLNTEAFYHLNFYRNCWHPIQVWAYLLVLCVSRAARFGSFFISTGSEWQVPECTHCNTKNIRHKACFRPHMPVVFA